MKRIILSILLLLGACAKTENIEISKIELIQGVDMSYLPVLRKAGFVAKNSSGQAEDMLITLQKAGVNTIRLRLWHTPSENYASLPEVQKISQEIRKQGFKIWLTLHYSDYWADPSQQNKPKIWENLTEKQLQDSVYEYTKKVMTQIKPDYIQIGNEINNGFLWKDGLFSKLNSFKTLLKQGIRAVREANSQTSIILHYAGHQEASYFFDNLQDLDYDIIGLSYYPFWHGKNLVDLEKNMQNLAKKTQKKVLIAETSYPFTLSWNDLSHNVIGSKDQILDDFSATPQGQKAYLAKIKSIIKQNPQTIGFCYWGGEWVSFPPKEGTSSWENQALWDFDGKALPVLEVFAN